MDILKNESNYPQTKFIDGAMFKIGTNIRTNKIYNHFHTFITKKINIKK